MLLAAHRLLALYSGLPSGTDASSCSALAGLANPGPVAAALWTDEELEAGVSLDAVVTVVDAGHIGRQLAEPRPDGVINEAQLQIAYADLVLLNKTDLVDEAGAAKAEQSILAINSQVEIIRTQRSRVDLQNLLTRR